MIYFFINYQKMGKIIIFSSIISYVRKLQLIQIVLTILILVEHEQENPNNSKRRVK
jgi:hypothetical protein